jgi:O-antigen ligase
MSQNVVRSGFQVDADTLARTRGGAKAFPYTIPLLLLAHIPLGMVMREMPVLATIHALSVLVLGLLFLVSDKRPYRLIYLCAYTVGSEVLWRGTHADIFWEYAKYEIGALLILSIFKNKSFGRADKRSLPYFLLLLPSIGVMPEMDRGMISFNVSGPFALAASTMFFSTVKLNETQLRRVLLAIVLPVVSLAALVLTTTLAAGTITFGSGSNFATSGNIGPNQVSAILGLGALATVLYALTEKEEKLSRVLMIGCGLWLTAQCVFTFSRGGFLTSVGAILFSMFYVLRSRRSRVTFVLVGGVILLLSYFVIFPAMDDYTGGALADRYENSGATGRDLIVQTDLIAFWENPLFGVGPHQSKEYHALLFRFSSSHTEYSRMLAEHGTFGLFSLLILSWLSWQRFRAKQPPLEKAHVMCFTVWALLFMSHAAMRLAAPSFMFGLAAASLLFESDARLSESINRVSSYGRLFYSNHRRLS